MIENNIPNMIQTGQFGCNNPIDYYQNPYQQNMGNMISIGATNYNQGNSYVYQPVQQQSTYENPYANVNPAVFQQYHDYYNQYNYNNNVYQQPYSNGYGTGYYGYNDYGQYQGPFQTAMATQYGYEDPSAPSYGQTQIYDRYATMNQIQPQNQNTNPYGYGGYQSYQQQYMQQQQESLQMLKLKAEIACAACHKTLNEEEFDRRFNPNHPSNQLSDEEIIKNREFENMKQFSVLFNNPPVTDTPGMSIAKQIARISSNYHQYFDNMSMREFLDNHLWRLKREWWLRENIDINHGHDLSSTYSSQGYNALLQMHSESDSYIHQLLDTSRYDNNLDDMELGLKEALDLEKRKKAILEGRVPEFISSHEAIEARHKWLNGIEQLMIKKNERRSNSNV